MRRARCSLDAKPQQDLVVSVGIHVNSRGAVAGLVPAMQLHRQLLVIHPGLKFQDALQRLDVVAGQEEHQGVGLSRCLGEVSCPIGRHLRNKQDRALINKGFSFKIRTQLQTHIAACKMSQRPSVDSTHSHSHRRHRR